jgi:transposase-like protein
MTGSKISDETRLAIVEASRRGDDRKIIALRFGVSESFCYAIARKAGVMLRPRPSSQPTPGRSADAEVQIYLEALHRLRTHCVRLKRKFHDEMLAAVLAHEQKLVAAAAPVAPKPLS